MPIYMKYGDIKGDVTEAGHVDWIELTGASFGNIRGGGGVGGVGGAGKPTGHPIEEINATKPTDKASAALAREAISGKGTAATIDFAQSDGHVFLTVNLEGTLIAAFSVSGGGDRPTESLQLNFSKIDFVKG